MNAGKLRDRIVLQARQSGVDELGQPVEVWADVATLWAHVRFLSGLELVKSGAESALVIGSVRIRPYAVDPTMRVAFSGLHFDITSVLPSLDYTDLTIKELP